MKKKTIGKVSTKSYKCRRCGAIENHSTNHWGAIYIRCKGCSWKNLLEPIVVFDCEEPLPEGYEKPPEWKQVKLGDIVKMFNPKKGRK